MVLLSLFFLSVPCGAGQAPALDEGSNLMLRSPDINFVAGLSLTAAGQVELGNLAVQRSSNPEVQAFGRLMVDEYTAMGPKLRNIVAAKRMTLPADLTAGDLALRHKIEYLSSPRFDRVYIKAMAKQNAARVKSFRREIKKGRDPAIQSFASETLPVIESNLEKARSLQRALKGKPRPGPS
jgi:putative membrane protein